MSHSELLEELFIPIAVVLNFKVLVGGGVFFSVLWLIANKFLKLRVFPFLSLILWWFIRSAAVTALALTGAIYLLAPHGMEFYRVIFSTLVAAPLLVAAILTHWCKPA